MKLKQAEKQIIHNLLLVRRVQEEIIKRYHPADKMKCPMHFCVGQEIMPSVLGLFLKKDDSIYSHHRSHGYYLCKKGSLKKMIAEFYGKNSGTNGGLAGSQELSEPEISFYSGTILSGALAMGVGDAFSKKYNKKKFINVSVIGDGGMEEGIVSESINLACMYKLPIIFICENNLYSTHTHLNERQKNKDIALKTNYMGLETTVIKTNNPNEIVKKVENIVKKARKCKPQFVEVQTYRLGSHVGPEDDDIWNYRPKKELVFWKKKDPLIKYKKILSNRSDFNKFVEVTEKNLKQEIDGAFDFAEKSNFPKNFIDYNYSRSFGKNVKFYQNNIKFGSEQEGHKPKPY